MQMITLVVDPESQDRYEQDHCCYDEDDFHGLRMRWIEEIAIRASAQRLSAGSTA
jgi:hypothetical protein